MRVRCKNLAFTEEEIEELVDMKYGSRDLFGLLTILFPFVDTRNQFHIDHIFPKSLFRARKLKELGISEDDISEMQENKDRLPNLQLLQGPDNISKNDLMPTAWIKQTFKTDDERKDYISRHLLGEVAADLIGFNAFYIARRKRLIERISEVLNRPTDSASESAKAVSGHMA